MTENLIDGIALALPPGMELDGPLPAGAERVLTPGALRLVAELARRHGRRVEELLESRRELQRRLDQGERPAFPAATAHLREAAWEVAPLPPDLLDRCVEITGPTDRTTVVDALNSGASVFTADLEDATSPTWRNIVEGQINLRGAVEGTLEYTAPETGSRQRLHAHRAVLMVRPRGWHLPERHVRVDGRPVAAALWDFGICFWNNARELLARGSGPYFSLPKLEGHLEARLWNDVFVHAQAMADLPRGTIRATCLIETLPAAFEMDEMLWELREHSAGLSCGRWNLVCSFVKRLRSDPCMVLPDRRQITMDQGFLRACAELLVRTCQRRGAPAMGGVVGGRDRGAAVTADDLLRPVSGARTEAGLRHDIRVSVQVLESWLRGRGRVSLDGRVEDAATAESCRALAWQWIHHGVPLDDGRPLTVERFRTVLAEELDRIRLERGEASFAAGRFEDARALLERSSTGAEFVEFVTLPAYAILEEPHMHGTSIPAANAVDESPAPHHPDPHRWNGVLRRYGRAQVERLRGSVHIEHTVARMGAERLWTLLHERPWVPALGALTGNQAVQMVRAGLEAIYLSGWQVAADANTALQTYPDQSLYPADSVPQVVRRINRALQRADEIEHAEGRRGVHWFAPIVADAEAGFGGPLNAFELMKAMIEAGAAGVHFEDQVAAEKKCGHLGGKVLVPTSTFVRTLTAARLAADVLGVPTVLVARTDAEAASLIMSDVDPLDAPFIVRDQRTPEGFFRFRGGVEAAIARGIAYAPYADLVWCETQTPDLDFARRFAEAIHAKAPGKLLAYNCSPSFNWRKHMDESALGKFQRELAAMGYRFQFVTLAGFHALNHSMFQLARGYRERGMAAYSDLQEAEISAEATGYTATRHQREVGVGYFDLVTTTVSGGTASTLALEGSTEKAQFRPATPAPRESARDVQLAVDEDHRRLEDLLRRLERSLDVSSLSAALEDLSRALREHFAHEEHAKGLYGLVGSREPGLRDELERLVEEHQDILQLVSGLVERMRTPERMPAGELTTLAGGLAARIAEHESRELRLVTTLL